jgi:hypothetical protein
MNFYSNPIIYWTRNIKIPKVKLWKTMINPTLCRFLVDTMESMYQIELPINKEE